MKILVNCSIVKNFSGEKCLFGEIYNDERFEDGHHILTTKIVKLDNMVCTTESGTVYHIRNLLEKEELEKLIDRTYTDEEYVKYLKRFIK